MSNPKKVILINPPFDFILNPGLSISYPLGLMYMAATLEKKGMEVKIIDFIDNKNIRYIAKIIKENYADIFGISMLSANRSEVPSIVRLIRNFHKFSKIVLGGIHATILYKQILEQMDIDAIFLGESEFSFAEYVIKTESIDDIRNKIPGIAFQCRDGEIKCTERKWIEDIDVIPTPAFHLIDLDRYKSRFNRIDFHLVTSRGCPFKCTFCSLPAISGGRYRTHSVNRVLEELEIIKSFKKNGRLMFHDDFFAINTERTRHLCKGMIKRKINLKWVTRSRVDTVDLDTLKLMKESGCEEIFYGVETGSDKILKDMNKEFNIEDVKRAFALTKESGIKSMCNIMIGYPGENNNTLNETRRLLSIIRPNKVYFCIVRMFPGTKLYYEAKKSRIIDDSFWFNNGNKIPFYVRNISYIYMLWNIYKIRLSWQKSFIRRVSFIFKVLFRETFLMLRHGYYY